MLERLKDRLDGCIGCGCLSFRVCKLVNPGDEAAAAGPGPDTCSTTADSGNRAGVLVADVAADQSARPAWATMCRGRTRMRSSPSTALRWPNSCARSAPM